MRLMARSREVRKRSAKSAYSLMGALKCCELSRKDKKKAKKSRKAFVVRSILPNFGRNKKEHKLKLKETEGRIEK